MWESLTRKMVQEAIEYALPSIHTLMDHKVFESHHLHIVAGDPSILHSNMSELEWYQKGIFHEFSLGKKKEWKYPYDKYARRKCYMSFRENRSTYDLLTKDIDRLKTGDTIYYGSIIEKNFAIGTSGVQPQYDEMISTYVLAGCRALCRTDPPPRFAQIVKDGFIT